METGKIEETQERLSFNYQDNPSIQGLLDLIANIIATAYIQTARQNPTVFV
jgi:hypothetical protein